MSGFCCVASARTRRSVPRQTSCSTTLGCSSTPSFYRFVSSLLRLHQHVLIQLASSPARKTRSPSTAASLPTTAARSSRFLPHSPPPQPSPQTCPTRHFHSPRLSFPSHSTKCGQETRLILATALRTKTSLCVSFTSAPYWASLTIPTHRRLLSLPSTRTTFLTHTLSSRSPRAKVRLTASPSCCSGS